MKKKIISIIVIFMLLMMTNYSVYAEQSYQQQSEQAAENKENAQQELEEVNGEIDTALQEIEDLNTSIDSLQTEIEELTTKVTSLNKSIEEKEKDLKSKQKLLEERLVASYMNGDNTYLDALLSGGLLNFITNYNTIQQIADYDTNLMNEVENAKNELEEEKTEIETAKTEKEKKSSEMKQLKNDKQSKVDSLTEEQKQIQSQIDEYDNQMKILAQKEKAQAVAEAAKKTTTTTTDSTTDNVASSGQFLWPVPSSTTISSKYGYRIHPISGTRKLHAGLDISAAGGANILAAESGTVILASYGYNGGYGNYVIISHGNGITTRYAHCSSLAVSTGDQVIRGQVIAAVGSTGASTGNHCHFEVRINGESTDPTAYL